LAIQHRERIVLSPPSALGSKSSFSLSLQVGDQNKERKEITANGNCNINDSSNTIANDKFYLTSMSNSDSGNKQKERVKVNECDSSSSSYGSSSEDNHHEVKGSSKKRNR
jgi:hypothetical protein